MSDDRNKKNGSPLDDPHILSGPFWGELRVFLAVAKAKSFNRAAEELNMSQPTVSRQVRRLQDVMGTQLVVSTALGIRLTRNGEELAKSLLDLDQKLFDISNDLTAEARAAEGTVRVTAIEGLTGLFLAPKLAAFNEQYPKIRVQLRAPADLVNFRENATDVMVAFAPSRQPDVTSRPLGYLHCLPFASRIYIERYGVPTRANLSNHYFLQCDYFAQDNGLWDDWRALIARGTLGHTCDNTIAYGLMVKSGLGIGLFGTYVLSDPDAIPLELGVRIRVPMYALAPTERLAAKPVRVVFDWIAELLAPSVPWFTPELTLDQLPRQALTPTVVRLLAGPGPTP